MSLAGFIQGMGSPIDTASRQADLFTKLQGLSDSQVRAEQLRLQRLRDEQYRQGLIQPVESPEDLAGGAPAPMVTPTAAAAPAPAAAPTSFASGSGRGNLIPPLAGQPQPVYPPANVPLTGPYVDPAGYKPPAGMSGPEQLRQLQAARLNRFGNPQQAAQTSQATNAQRAGLQPPPVDGRTVNIPMDTVATTPDFNALAEAVKMVESGGDPGAVSPKGALGTMQTMPTTLTNPGFGVRPAQDSSPAEMERVGRDYLQAMIAKYPGQLDHALAAYNWGPGNVDKWIAAGADPAKLPKETRDYIPKVMARLGGQPAMAAAPTAPTPPGAAPAATAAAPAAPAMQFSPEQVTRVSTAVQQDLRVKQLQLTEINRLLALAPDVQTAQNLRNQANEIRFGAYQAQLVNASAQALGGDEQAVAQLANAARVQYAQTDAGYVPVQLGADGQYQATGQPMTRERFINALFSEATGAAQKARDAQAAAMAKAQGEIAVERVKTEGKLYESQAAAERELQKLISERQLARNDVKGVEFDPIRGTMFVRTASGVSMMVPGEDLGGGITSEPRLVRVQ